MKRLNVAGDREDGVLDHGRAVAATGKCGERIADVVAADLDRVEPAGRRAAARLLQKCADLRPQVDVDAVLVRSRATDRVIRGMCGIDEPNAGRTFPARPVDRANCSIQVAPLLK